MIPQVIKGDGSDTYWAWDGVVCNGIPDLQRVQWGFEAYLTRTPTRSCTRRGWSTRWLRRRAVARSRHRQRTIRAARQHGGRPRLARVDARAGRHPRHERARRGARWAVRACLDGDGAFEVELRATDDPDLLEWITGTLVYRVVRELSGSITRWSVLVPSPGPWDWTQLSPAPARSDVVIEPVPAPGPQGDQGEIGPAGPVVHKDPRASGCRSRRRSTRAAPRPIPPCSM